ncbi:MAG: hypothetical protein ACUVWA_11790 [Candidatus Oleimicrobiaceae bacterium]
MALFGLFVLSQAICKLLNPLTPQFETIGVIGACAGQMRSAFRPCGVTVPKM